MPTWKDLYNTDYDIESDYNSDEFFDGPIYPDKINKKSRGVVDGNFIPPLKENKDNVPLTDSDKAPKQENKLTTSDLNESKKRSNQVNVNIKSNKRYNDISIINKSSKRNNEI